MPASLADLDVATLRKVLAIHEEIESLQASLAKVMGGASTQLGRRGRPPKAASSATGKVDGRKKPRSAATIAKMKAAAKARWAARKGTSASPASAVNGGKKKKKRTMSPEARARIAAAQKARWAKQKS